ncbi:hypothetical protein JCM10207_007602 [Rhodosporidiobolus poonsookiae]
MPKPSAADLLASQLQHAASSQHSRPAYSPLSAPPSSSFSSSGFSSPLTPGTPWSNDSPPLPANGRKHSTPAPSGLPAAAFGLGISEAGGYSDSSRPKLAGRGATRRRGEEEEEEETDDELEDELLDFGYGAPKRKPKEKKESLMDILNSEPPEWLTREPATLEPIEVHEAPVPTRGFTKKFRQRFATSSPSATGEDDPQAAFSTLRSSRSAGNLLGSLRKGSLASRTPSNRSRDDLHQRSDAAFSSLHSVPATVPVDEFARLPPQPPLRKLAAKDASTSATSSTRDLADFLRSSGPPVDSYPVPPSLDRSESLSLGSRSRSRSTLHKPRPSRSGTTGGRAPSPSRESIDTTGSTTVSVGASVGVGGGLKAAMHKLGGAGRRASIIALQQVETLKPSSSSSTGASSSSEDGTGDIRVDAALLDGMFGLMTQPLPPPRSSSYTSHKTTTSSSSKHGRLGSSQGAQSRPVNGAWGGFPERDERERVPRAGLPTETTAGALKGMTPPAVAPVRQEGYPTGPGLTRSGSLGSQAALSPTSPTRVLSPHKLARKPAPVAAEEELLASPTSASPTRKAIRDETLVALMRLQDRGDTSPLAVGESPIKGLPSAGQQVRPLPSPTTRIDLPAPSPTTPGIYSTPPTTPTPASAAAVAAATTPTPKAYKRLSVAGSFPPDSRPASPAPEAPLPAPPVASSGTRAAHAPHQSAPPSQSFGNAARRLSQLEPPSFSSSLGNGSTLAPTASQDSVIDPPLSARALHPIEDASSASNASTVSLALPCTVRVDDPLLEALDALRASMRATADLPLELGKVLRPVAPADAGDPREDDAAAFVEALLPTLRGMKAQMALGAELLGKVLKRLEGPCAREGGAVEVESVVEALLDGDAVEQERYEERQGWEEEEKAVCGGVRG